MSRPCQTMPDQAFDPEPARAGQLWTAVGRQVIGRVQQHDYALSSMRCWPYSDTSRSHDSSPRPPDVSANANLHLPPLTHSPPDHECHRREASTPPCLVSRIHIPALTRLLGISVQSVRGQDRIGSGSGSGSGSGVGADQDQGNGVVCWHNRVVKSVSTLYNELPSRRYQPQGSLDH